jgi:hypothetical protein
MKLPLPFATYKLDATQASAKRLVNCYAEQLPQDDGKGRYILKRAPGIKPWGTVGTLGRGLHAVNGALYAVSGNTLYRVAPNGVGTALGTIPGTGLTSIAHNTNTVVVVSKPHAYYYNGSFGQITDPDFTSRGASQVVFLGNWLIFLEPDSGRQFGADFGTATSFDALNFATAEGSPDNTIQLLSDKQQLAQFGTESVELAYNSGRSGYPFERIPSGGDFNLGSAAANSGALFDNTFGWLASDLTVRTLRGVTPTRISTHAIEEQIRSLPRKDDAIGFSFTLDGHIYYVLTFPSAARTFVYDVTSQQWHERESWQKGRWRPISYAYCYGKHLVQDYETGRIGELDPKTYSEWGEIQRMQWTYPTVYADSRLAFFDRLEVIAEKGVGLIAGQGSEAEIMLEASDDGGKTYSLYPNNSFGRMGQYKFKTDWWSLGSAEQRSFRCVVSDPVTATVADTQLYWRGGRA